VDQDEEWATIFGKREQSHIQTLLNSTQKEKKHIKVPELFKDLYQSSK